LTPATCAPDGLIAFSGRGGSERAACASGVSAPPRYGVYLSDCARDISPDFGCDAVVEVI
jgi:hypothetical protein